MIRIEYLRDVHSPPHMRGTKGEVRSIENWWAEMLTEGCDPYARYCDDPKTGEPIVYPPPPAPRAAKAESAVAAQGVELPPIHTTETKDLTHGIAHEGANQEIDEARVGESSDTRMG